MRLCAPIMAAVTRKLHDCKGCHVTGTFEYRTFRCFSSLIVAGALAGCSSTFPLMPTPALYAGHQGRPLFTNVPAESQVPSLDLLYITDRQRATKQDDSQPYSSERSRSMAFGSVTVEFGAGLTWEELAKQSTQSKRLTALDLELGSVKELGRFPDIPYDVKRTATGVTRDPAVVDAHEKAAAGLRAEVARRLAASPRKEVVLFVHGYANTFRDAALTMGELCHYLGREFVCAIFSWPAGGSRNVFLGYNVDRESGEFAVLDLKKTIRIIAGTPGVERVHLLAHSRGADVLATAMAQLSIESYVANSPFGARFNFVNVVLMAPDIDADVATSKIFTTISDPDLRRGDAPEPRGVFPPPRFRLTVYVSPDDKALSLSEWLFGGLRRLGRIDGKEVTQQDIDRLRRLAFVDVVQVSGTTDPFGHSYFTSNPEVSADLIAMIRYGLKPNEPGRPLIEVSRPLWKVIPRETGGVD
jgi:esterase/lipase superfamily enzyme